MIEQLEKKYKKENIHLTSPRTGKTYDMSVYEMCRWFSLIEAVDIVDKKLKQTGLSHDNKKWVKPIPLQKYVDERSDSMLFDLVSTDELRKIKVAG